MRRTVWLLFTCFVVATRVFAQAVCPTIVETAVQTAAEACMDLSRNQACYGNVVLEVDPQIDAPAFTFEQAGDIVDLMHISSLRLSPLDNDAGSWGVALLQVQANLPDTIPGQNVTMVLLGEVQMTSAVAVQPEATPQPTPVLLQVSVSSSINIRGGASTSDAVIASLNAGDSVTADGRNADGTWLSIQLPDGVRGWVFAELVTVDGDASTLAVTDGVVVETTEAAPAEPSYGPMQAFYFTSGVGDAPCAEAPDSGILIQTPQGVGAIDLFINEVSIRLGSTAYVQAGDGEMLVNVIEGQATVSAFGTTVTAPAGTRVRIPLDANGAASGAPVGPEPYDALALSVLPVVLLPEVVTVAAPLTDEEIAALAANNVLYLGFWTMVVTNECPALGGGDEVTFTIEHRQIPNASFPDWDQLALSMNETTGVIAPTVASTFITFLTDLERNQQLIIPGQYFQEYTSQDSSQPGSIEATIISSTSITGIVILEGLCESSIVMDATG